MCVSYVQFHLVTTAFIHDIYETSIINMSNNIWYGNYLFLSQIVIISLKFMVSSLKRNDWNHLYFIFSIKLKFIINFRCRHKSQHDHRYSYSYTKWASVLNGVGHACCRLI